MLILRNIKLPLDTDFKNLESLFCELFGVRKDEFFNVVLYKKSVDARKKDKVHYLCSFLIDSDKEKILLKKLKKYDVGLYDYKNYNYRKIISQERPVIIGFGPAGIFSALALARAGLKPIVFERGKDIDSRKKDVDSFFAGESLNTESNIQFGEGGAGTFSDGKLNTGINDFRIREVFRVFYNHGADENILYDSKPHIGTDVLQKVVKSIREEIISLGGEVNFENKLEKINVVDGKLDKVYISDKNGVFEIKCNYLILALGHSARDTFEMLNETGLEMHPKDFAVGVRIEHNQSFIDKSQYGEAHSLLDAADYKLSTHLDNGRGVFTFCMCPGGVVVNASSEKNGVATNGMSYKTRDGENANSAVLVNVKVDDYYKDSVLDGMYFQREIERKAFEIGNGYTVSQKFGDFLNKTVSDNYDKVKPTVLPKSTNADINLIFPEFINSSLKEGIKNFGKKIAGFDSEFAVLTAPETRSSSPIRILRNDLAVSSVLGVYPCGEGAGYAGGITSSAVDGLKTAERIIEVIENKNKL